MKIIELTKKAMLFSLLLVAFIACEDEKSEIINDGNPPETPPIAGNKISKYVLGFSALPIGGSNSVDYILSLPNIESLTKGEISIEGKGTPLKAWRFFHQAGNTVFSPGYSEDKKAIAFQLDNNGELEEVSSFTYQATLDNFSAVDDETLIGVELSGVAPTNEAGTMFTSVPDRTFYIVNAKTGKLQKTVEHPIDSNLGDGTLENPPYLPWVTGMVLRNGKLFVSYHKLFPDNKYNQAAPDKAYIAVFDYPSFKLDKLIEDDRLSVLGINGHSTGIEKTETGDIYAYAASSKGAKADGTKPSGIIRIKNGSTDFDKDYFFDVENAPNGGKIFWMDYIGNGKALARIIKDDSLPEWAFFAEQGPFFKLAIIDFNNKTVTDVQGISAHANRYTAPLFVEDGKAYLSARVGNPIGIGATTVADGEAHIYIIDPATATATKGAKINGLYVKGIFKIDNQN
ncbi:DUF4374 domain-containing protein [Aquimarina agarilytica]|uniref:DUF4374 domain-containing protein n=1 Tax=Aquimarina agarilytica TaxID=1087449 RepID=UPI0002890E64|nr:DUF4374 domain-containing protein [Aquimarina agarilytica]